MAVAVLTSSETQLELGSAQSGLKITASGSVSLPLLEPGRGVSLTIRLWGMYPNFRWFVVVRDAVSRELILALHRGNSELFDGATFGEAAALGFALSVGDLCETFDSEYDCTTAGAHLTQMIVDVDGDEIPSGETRTVSVEGQPLRIWVGSALRVRTPDFSTECNDWTPEDIIHFTVKR